MIEEIAIFFSIEMIYLWLNIGVIPFWFILMFFPQSKVCGLFVTSIIPTFGSIEDIESFVAISDGEYLKQEDVTEIERIFDSWEPYELKFTQPDVLNYINSKNS